VRGRPLRRGRRRFGAGAAKQAPDGQPGYEQGENQQGYRYEATKADPGPENDVDGLQDDELAVSSDKVRSR
jgi:hypothetical protein